MAASCNKDAVGKYVGKFHNFVNTGGYFPQQVFNCDMIGLFLKMTPNRTYITEEENPCLVTHP